MATPKKPSAKVIKAATKAVTEAEALLQNAQAELETAKAATMDLTDEQRKAAEEAIAPLADLEGDALDQAEEALEEVPGLVYDEGAAALEVSDAEEILREAKAKLAELEGKPAETKAPKGAEAATVRVRLLFGGPVQKVLPARLTSKPSGKAKTADLEYFDQARGGWNPVSKVPKATSDTDCPAWW